MEDKKHPSGAILCAVLAAALYALSVPGSKLLLGGVQPTVLAALLYLGAGLGLMLIGGLRRASGHEGREQPLTREDLPYTIAMIVLDIAAPILLLCGLSRTTAANAALLNNFEIVATALIALTLFHEAVSRRLWCAIGLVTAASVLLSCEDIGGSMNFSAGSLFVLGACICWGLENNCTRKLSHKDPLEIVVVKGLCSGTGSLLIAFALGERLPTAGILLYGLCLGFAAYGLSIYFYIRAQRTLGAAKTGAFYAIAPFLGSALSLVLLREKPDGLYWLALAVMALGVYYASTDGAHSHAGVRSIDYFAYTSGMNRWNPTFKVLLSVGTLILCIAANDPLVSVAVILVCASLIVYKGGLELHAYLSMLRIPLFFLLVSGIAVACDLSAQPIGDWNLSLRWFYVCITGESLRFALLLTLKALGAVNAMYLLALSTPASELVGVLRRAKLPALLTELMYLIYRFIFILLDAHSRMYDAAESRMGYRDFHTSIRSFGGSAGNLLVVALRKSGVYYDAMLSRCYDGSLGFLEEDKPLQRHQILAVAAFWGALIVLWLI